MPEEQPPDETSPPRPSPRKGMTPEQRRFLATPRAPREEPAAAEEPAGPEPTPDRPAPEASDISRRPREMHRASPAESEATAAPEESIPELAEESRPSGGMLRPDQTAARTGELRRAILVLSGILLLVGAFYVGLKFPYWKYRFYTSRHEPKLEEPLQKKFAGISSDELIKQALEAERAGNLKDAAERLIAAKYKDRSYRGILARVGRMAYEKRDFDSADKLFERAIAFGENLDTANFFRGMIATRRKDLPAAERFFEAATVAAPFVADYQFSFGDALRLDHRPRDAVSHYERAILLSKNDLEAAVCRFKIRMARMEAGEESKLSDEVKAQAAAGKISVDWLLTSAALHIRAGEVDEAIPLIELARDENEPGVFGACVSDAFFIESARTHPRLVQVCRPPGR
ncbi:MAG: tetratricopeptide repeat protein [Chthoniobacterales bacterium]